MKIKFLGTSAAWPLPRLGCTCELCSSKDPKDTRTRTQLLVNDSILIDAGPDTYKHLLFLDRHPGLFAPTQGELRERSQDSSSSTQNDNSAVKKITSILISHEHPDHILGFWDLNHIYNDNQIINIYVTSHLASHVNNIIGPHKKNLRIKVVKENQPFIINNVKVEYFPVIHGKTPAWGIKLKENRIFIYITDFKRILPSQEKTIKHADYWAIDGSTLGKIGQGPGHISITDGIALANKYKIEQTYFVHIGHKTGTHRFLENHLAQKAGKNFHISYDGLELNI